MNIRQTFPLTLVALAVLAGCSAMPPNNARLDQARSEYQLAQNDPLTRELASGELKQAGDALNTANDAWSRKDSPAEIDHLAYLAKQHAAIAQAVAQQRSAERTVARANAARDKMLLTARTNEADAAQRNAASSQSQSIASQQQAADAQAHAAVLEQQLKDLNAKQTARGMVITFGDVLFDTDQARLKSGGVRDVEKLVGFLNEYPQRKALIEGFTDSTGGTSHNQELSIRRADAVRTALVGMGISRDRVATRGYSEEYPVAGNDSAGGRRLNRRVEIVLSNDDGIVAPR